MLRRQLETLTAGGRNTGSRLALPAARFCETSRPAPRMRCHELMVAARTDEAFKETLRNASSTARSTTPRVLCCRAGGFPVIVALMTNVFDGAAIA